MAIFERLERGPLPVGEIARGLPVTRSAVSQHLKVLKHVGLVTSQRAANRQIYRIDAGGVAGLRDYFDRFLAGVPAVVQAGCGKILQGETSMNAVAAIPPV